MLKKIIFIFLPISTFGQDLSLQNALSIAKVNNSILKVEKLNYNLAEADMLTANLRPNMILNNQSLQLMRSSSFTENSLWFNNKNRQVWWQLTKPIQLPNQRQNKIDLAKKTLLFVEKSYTETERNFLLNVANQWLDSWGIKKRIELVRKAQANLDTLVTTNQYRFKAQVITETDLIRAQLLLEQYNLQLTNIELEYKNTLQDLKLLLGTKEDIEVSINLPIELAFLPTQFNDLLKQGLESRSDVKVGEANIELNNSNIKLQKSLAIPRPELGMIWNPQNNIPYFGFFGTVSLPFFDKNQGNIKRSQIQKMQAEHILENTKLKIQIEIQAAYQSYQLQKENLLKFDNILKQSEKVLNNVRYTYLKGGTTIIDYLDAQRSWVETRQLYYETQLTYYRSYIQLLYATGQINQL